MQQNTQDLTINKLIILLLLKNINTKISQTKITEFILYKEYTDYFSLQQYLVELVNANLIDMKKIENTTYYSINQKGIDILSLFINRIPYSTREEILEYTIDNLELDISNNIEATISQIDGNFYTNCSIKDRDKTLIEINIKSNTEDEAHQIRSNWLRRAKSIYKTIVDDVKK